MRKGTKIKEAHITGSYISATDPDGDEIKLTRAQRDVLSHYKESDYIDQIHKAFDNYHILDDEFSVYKNGNMVMTTVISNRVLVDMR